MADLHMWLEALTRAIQLAKTSTIQPWGIPGQVGCNEWPRDNNEKSGPGRNKTAAKKDNDDGNNDNNSNNETSGRVGIEKGSMYAGHETQTPDVMREAVNSGSGKETGPGQETGPGKEKLDANEDFAGQSGNFRGRTIGDTQTQHDDVKGQRAYSVRSRMLRGAWKLATCTAIAADVSTRMHTCMYVCMRSRMLREHGKLRRENYICIYKYIHVHDDGTDVYMGPTASIHTYIHTLTQLHTCIHTYIHTGR